MYGFYKILILKLTSLKAKMTISIPQHGRLNKTSNTELYPIPSPSIPGWLGTHYVNQSDLELIEICLSSPPEIKGKIHHA